MIGAARVSEAMIRVGTWSGKHAYTGSDMACAHCGHTPRYRGGCTGPVDDIDLLAETLLRLHDGYYIGVKIEDGVMVYRLSRVDDWVTADGGDDLRKVLRKSIEWEVKNDEGTVS